MLESGVDEMPLVEDVRASRSGGPDGAGVVVVEGVWGAVTGGPPPVLLVDDGTKRHTLVALDEPPRDDPMAFHATFAIPPELVDALGRGLALGLGRTELPLALSEPETPAADGWLQGPPVIARRMTPEAVAAPEPAAEPEPDPAPEPAAAAEDDLPDGPSRRRFDRGESAPSHSTIAAAILRATAPPPDPGSTVVERSVIAERRARRSEQLAAVMERRARGAEDTAQELVARISALEARVAEITQERDRLSAQLALQRSATGQAQAARVEAEGRLAELLEAEGDAPPHPDAATMPTLPGLEEVARAMRDQEPARPVSAPEPEAVTGADPFADALAKLRSNGGAEELAAAVAPSVVAEPAQRETVAAFAPPAAALQPTHVVPYLISAEHPRSPWLSRAIAALDDRDRDAAALLVAQLLPHQASGFGRPLAYDLDLAGLDPVRVELGERGAGEVVPREAAAGDPAFTVAATPAQFAGFAGGGASRWPRGLRTGGALLPFLRLASKRRRPVSLAELVAAGLPLDPALVVRALAQAVPASWTAGEHFAVTVSVPGQGACRVLAEDGAPLRVLAAEPARRAVVAATSAVRVPTLDGADALLDVSQRGALPLLAQAEPPAEEEPATVVGDVQAATRLLGWFDRVQGLGPRA